MVELSLRVYNCHENYEKTVSRQLNQIVMVVETLK